MTWTRQGGCTAGKHPAEDAEISWWLGRRKLNDHTQIPRSSLLPHSARYQARQHVTKDVMLMAGSVTEALGQRRQAKRRKLFADKRDLVLGSSSINWRILLVERARYHGGFRFYAPLAKWMTLKAAKAFGHAKVPSTVKQMAGDRRRERQWTADGEEIMQKAWGMHDTLQVPFSY